MKVEAGAILLAGGLSSRIKRDKAFLEFNGLTLVERAYQRLCSVFPQVVVVANSPQPYLEKGIEVVSDLIPGRGPLGGIYTGLSYLSFPLGFVVACDMPFFSLELARTMVKLGEGFDVVVPKVGENLEPLHAVYRKTCLPVIREIIQRGPARVTSFYPQLRVYYYSSPELASQADFIFFNINTPSDWEQAIKVLGENVYGEL